MTIAPPTPKPARRAAPWNALLPVLHVMFATFALTAAATICFEPTTSPVYGLDLTDLLDGLIHFVVIVGCAFVGLAVCVVTVGLAALRWAFGRSDGKRTLVLVGVGLAQLVVGSAPLLAWICSSPGVDGERAFLAENRARLEETIRGERPAPDGYYGYWTVDHAHVFVVGPAGLDAYWIVYDPCEQPWTAHPDIDAVERLEQLEGPWFSMVH